MTAPKFTHRDRAHIAAQLFASLPATKTVGIGQKSMTIAERIEQAAVHADALLAALAETTAPACVGEDPGALDAVAALLPYAKGQLIRLQSIAHEDGLNDAGSSAMQRVTEDVQRFEQLLRDRDYVPRARFDVLAAFAAIVPYAESRAEDMSESAEADTTGHAPESKRLADKACSAVEGAKKLLRENGVVVP